MALATVLIPAVHAVTSRQAASGAGKGSAKPPTRVSMLGDFSHLGEAVKKDVNFIRRKVGRGLEWANKAFRIPVVSKLVDDLVWLMVLENSGYYAATEDNEAGVPWVLYRYSPKRFAVNA